MCVRGVPEITEMCFEQQCYAGKVGHRVTFFARPVATTDRPPNGCIAPLLQVHTTHV